jgi:hypothetical protein
VDEAVKEWALDTMLRFYDAVQELDIAAGLKEMGW